LVPFLLKIFSLDATFKSVGDVNNVYAFQKKAVAVVRIIGDGGGGGLKKSAKFSTKIFNTSLYVLKQKKFQHIFS
jgi:hypothetical protein